MTHNCLHPVLMSKESGIMEMFEELCSFLGNNFFTAIPPADVFSQSVSVFASSTVHLPCHLYLGRNWVGCSVVRFLYGFGNISVLLLVETF